MGVAICSYYSEEGRHADLNSDYFLLYSGARLAVVSAGSLYQCVGLELAVKTTGSSLNTSVGWLMVLHCNKLLCRWIS